MARVVHQRAVRAQQSEIDAPGIDSDTVQRQFALPAADEKRVPDFVEQPECIPIQTGWQAHRRVWKAVQFFEREPSAVERAEDGAPGFGAQVDGQKPAHASPRTLGCVLCS